MKQIERLREINSVKEVKGTDHDEVAVAIKGKMTYQDARMRTRDNKVLLPDEMLEWVNNNAEYEIADLGFYIAGDYEGCFVVTLKKVRHER